MQLKEQGEDQELMSRMKENQNQVELIGKSIEKEIFQIQQETAEGNAQRGELQEEIQQLKKGIQQRRSETKIEKDHYTFIGLKIQIFQLRKTKDANKLQIQQLRQRIKKQQQKFKNNLATINENRSLGQLLDLHISNYSKLQQINNLLTTKARLMSLLFNQTVQAKNIESHQK